MSKHTPAICIVNLVLVFASAFCVQYVHAFQPIRHWMDSQQAYVTLPIIVACYLPAIICLASDMRDWAKARR